MIPFLELILACGIVIALLIIFVSIRTRRTSSFDRQYFKNEWAKVLKPLSLGEQGWRLAIIDADKLLDHALKQHGARGQSMGDRMRDREKYFSHYNDLWAAHKLRNRLVHEPGVTLGKQLTHRALNEFQRALKELGALL